jgi:hypothetical protein
MLSFHPCSDIRPTRTTKLSAVRAGRTLPSKEITWYLFFLEDEWIPGLLKCT